MFFKVSGDTRVSSSNPVFIRMLFIFVFSSLFFVIFAEFAPPRNAHADTSWLSGGYLNRKKITIQNTYVDSNLTNFPVYVAFSSDVDIGAAALADGYDIRFTASDGTTLLSYEREDFTISGGEATGYFWVKVPTVSSSTSTDIYIYYGNADASDGESAAAVWTQDYIAVYHLNESGSGAVGEFKNSTENDHHGRGGGGTASKVPDQIDGIAYKAQDFPGSGDYIEIADDVDFDIFDDTFTLSAWVTATSTVDKSHIFGQYDGDNNEGRWSVRGRDDSLAASSGSVLYARDSGMVVRRVGGETTSVDGGWHLVTVAATASSTGITYLDDAADTHASSQTLVSNFNSPNKLTIGGNADGSVFSWSGKIDEIRISDVLRSAAWVEFEYRNITESDNELTFADEEDEPIAITVASATAQPITLESPSTDNVLGSASIVRNIDSGTVTAVTLKENSGTIDADGDLENIELWLSSDNTWDSGDTQIGSTGNFDDDNGEVTFTEDFTVTTTAQYLIVRGDLKAAVSEGLTFELQFKTVSSTDTVSGTTLEIEGTSTTADLWWDGSWLNRRKLTFDNGDQAENLIDFPVLVKLSSSNFDFSNAQSNGEDIRFLDSDNSTELKYEIELWDSLGESAIIWVKAPQIDASSEADFVYMYYNNTSASDNQDAANVWSNNYAAVYHFAEQSGFYQDSAGSNHADTQQVTSRNNTDSTGLGYYPAFVSASSDYVGIPDDTSLQFGTGDFTVMSRVKATDSLNDVDLFRKGSTATADPDSWWKLEWGTESANRVYWEVRVNNTAASAAYVQAPGSVWRDLWGTRDTSNTLVELFIDGAMVASSTGINGDVDPTTSTNIGIGSKDTYDDDHFDGNLDEVRFATTLRSDAWIAAQSDSLANTLISFGLEGDYDGTAPTITSVSSDTANGQYGVGSIIDIDVTFSEAVTSSGNVTVTLETGVTDQTCTFAVSNSTTGSCNYTVVDGDQSNDLTINSVSGTIRDQSGNLLTNSTPAVNLAQNKSIVINTDTGTVDYSILAPVVTPVNIPQNVTPQSLKTVFSRSLHVGSFGEDVRALQRLLNSQGFIMAKTGPGSFGNETTFFGILTKNAVARFQEFYAPEILRPLGLSVGTGFVGQSTLQKLNALISTKTLTTLVQDTPNKNQSSMDTCRFESDLGPGDTSSAVRDLQRYLNTQGFFVAEHGAGSVGNETETFGFLTQSAVIRFQEAHAAEILVPTGFSKGTGYVGPATRAYIHTHCE